MTELLPQLCNPLNCHLYKYANIFIFPEFYSQDVQIVKVLSC